MPTLIAKSFGSQFLIGQYLYRTTFEGKIIRYIYIGTAGKDPEITILTEREARTHYDNLIPVDKF